MITYPKQGDSFSIDTFRSSDGLHTLDYYIHVVNDETGICQCQLSHFNYEYVMKKYEELSKQCAKGWHIEITVGISQGEVRAKLK